MSRSETLEWLLRSRLVPVVRAESSLQAIRVVEALAAGGVDVFEITMTVPGAIDVIGDLCQEHGSRFLIGAGTVLSADQAEECLRRGARFIVAPNTDPSVGQAAHGGDAVWAPGALTPSEIVHAHSLGADIVKVFPCDAVGGWRYLKAVKAPLPHIRLMPTGGVELQTIPDFFKAGACAVGVGSNLVNLSLLDSDPGALTELARQFAAASRPTSASG